MPEMQDDDWTTLLGKIKAGKCTPFLGAGACAGVLPLGKDIASRLSVKYGYPWTESRGDLARVAQYVQVKHDRDTLNSEVQSEFAGKGPPNFSEPNEPHAVLAGLPLPIYITTNYDDFMFKAIEARKDKKPRRDLCRWSVKKERDDDREVYKEFPVVLESTGGAYEPKPSDPLVYHLHGVLEVPKTWVLTEDDYTDFLVAVAEDINLIPLRLQASFKETSLLFLGYTLNDPDFRVIFRYIHQHTRQGVRPLSVAVQLVRGPGGNTDSEARAVSDYLSKYLGTSNIVTKWCECREFASELRDRWKDYKRANS